jgi:hypothetical protein
VSEEQPIWIFIVAIVGACLILIVGVGIALYLRRDNDDDDDNNNNNYTTGKTLLFFFF